MACVLSVRRWRDGKAKATGSTCRLLGLAADGAGLELAPAPRRDWQEEERQLVKAAQPVPGGRVMAPGAGARPARTLVLEPGAVAEEKEEHGRRFRCAG